MLQLAEEVSVKVQHCKFNSMTGNKDTQMYQVEVFILILHQILKTNL